MIDYKKLCEDNDKFCSAEDILSAFSAPSNALDGCELIYAWTDDGYDCSASADVLYKKDGKFYLMTGTHCSCNGFEEWDPEEVTLEYVKETYRIDSKSTPNDKILWQLIEPHLP